MSDEISLNEPNKTYPVITPEQFYKNILNSLKIKATRDIVHEITDEEMCRVLESLGYGEGVEIFRKMPKSYG